MILTCQSPCMIGVLIMCRKPEVKEELPVFKNPTYACDYGYSSGRPSVLFLLLYPSPPFLLLRCVHVFPLFLARAGRFRAAAGLVLECLARLTQCWPAAAVLSRRWLVTPACSTATKATQDYFKIQEDDGTASLVKRHHGEQNLLGKHARAHAVDFDAQDTKRGQSELEAAAAAAAIGVKTQQDCARTGRLNRADGAMSRCSRRLGQ